MAGRGPTPNAQRRRRNTPTRGDWRATPGVGWQHGPIPAPPDGLRPATVAAWQTWMQSWWASYWLPADLPVLEHIIRLYDLCQSYSEDPYAERTTRSGDSVFVLKPNPAPELRQLLDSYGVTPKGQQDRRWAPPKDDEAAKKKAAAPAKGGRYAHLRAVG